MATKVIMPKQGLQMTEGTIIKWLVEENGDCVEGKPLFEMETDKLTITMDAPATGKLLKIIKKEGDVVPITEIIAVIGQPGEDISAFTAGGASVPAAAEQKAPETNKPAETSASQFDVAVIGGGPGGYIAAICAAKLGKKVAIVEERQFGGTCLNRGCIPTKALLHSAEVYQEMKNAAKLGISAENISFDYQKIAEKKDKVVKKLVGGVGSLLKANKVTTISGRGVLTSPTTFQVGSEAYSSDQIILATGSVPARVPLKGIDKPGVVTSDEVLSLTKCPESVVIIGGGVIGIEFATLFNKLGKKVTVIEMLPGIMAGIDEEISDTMAKVLKKEGVDIHTSAKVLEIKDGLTCVYEEGGKTLEAYGEMVVVAVGRKPNTKDIGLEAAGVASERGFIAVDDALRTNVKNIFAIGDITGKVQLAHVASAQGMVAAHNAAGKEKKMNYDIVPSCIYTTPEIAGVGLTEAKAKEKGLQVQIGKFQIGANGRSMIMDQATGLAKIITDKRTGEIYGASIMAPRATDMIAEIAVAMKAEATIEELSDTIHPHPTVSEIIMEAAHDVEGLCCHKI